MTRVRMTAKRAYYVTHRPGCSSFATSVRTLTGGSQATAILLLAGLVTGGVGLGPLRVSLRASLEACLDTSLATGTRTSTEVSATPSCRSAMVWVWPGDAGTAARSALAARLVPVSGTAAAT